MGLFGALFAGVSGLGSQSNKIGIVSNNISNVNTVGFKEGSAAFNTLVVPSASSGAFSPGGVLGNTRQLVSQQGLIQATTSVTDVAISGGGLFVVNTKADGSGDTLYTRAGSFTQDSSGNFINSAGLFLQGLKVQTPALSVNPGNLTTVNVNQNATGSSVSTSQINIAANFNAKQTALAGAGELATLAADTTNAANTAKQILVPTSGTNGNGLVRGDKLNIKVNNAATPDQLTYDGFNIGRNIATGAVGDGGYKLVSETLATGATISGTVNETTATLSNINVASTSASAAGSSATLGQFTAGTLSFGGVSIPVTAGNSLATIAANLQSALRARSGDAAAGNSTAIVTGTAGNYTLTVVDKLDAQTSLSGTAITTTLPATFTVSSASTSAVANATTAAISAINVANTGPTTAVASGAFSAGNLTFGTGANAVTIPVGAGDTLTNIATNLQAALQARGTDAAAGGSTVAITGSGGNYTLTVVDKLNTGTGFNGTSTALTGNSPTFTVGSASTIAAANATTGNISAINVSGTGGTNYVVGTGLFTAGTNALTFGTGTNHVDVTVTSTDTLTTLATKIQNALQARTGDSAAGGSTVSITGSAGNYTLSVVDMLNSGAGFSNTAVSGTPPLTVSASSEAPGNTRTTAAITNINLPDENATAAVGTGLFNAGTLTFGGTSYPGVSITVSTTDTLDTIASTLQTALRARTGDAGAGVSTVTVTGSPNNYQLTVVDKLNSGSAGFTGTAVTGSVTFNLTAATTTPTTGQITLSITPTTDTSSYVVGQTAYISGLTGSVGGVAASSINGQNLTIVSVDTTANTVTLGLPTGVTGTAGSGGGTAITLTNRTYAFAGNILDATTDSGDFLGTSGATTFASSSLNFSATVNGSSYTFNYNSAPNTSTGQFNSLETLASAINSSSAGELTASVVNHKLYVSATDANKGVTFTNGNASGTGTGSAHMPGINWIEELDLRDISDAATGVNRFNSMQSLADQVNTVDPANLIATVNNPKGISTVSINAADPQAPIQFYDDTTSNLGGSLVEALGFKGVNGNPLLTETMTNSSATGYDTGTFTAVYNASNSQYNMSSGAVTPQFSKDITVYDSLGISHTIAMNVLKLSDLKWAVEFTAVPATDVTSTTNDGKVTDGIITFNGDGSLKTISGNLSSSTTTFKWTNGADFGTIALTLGTQGLTDGLTQFAGASNVSQAAQNGSPTGQLTGVSIDSSGYIVASFSNGQTQKLYQIPLASVNNPNGLEGVSGNAYKQTLSSGEVSLSIAGTNGTGSLSASALEQSNVDLSTQLTDLIVAQQAYGANTRVLTVTSQLLQQLNQIIQ